MPRNNGQPIGCKTCGAIKAAAEFDLQGKYRAAHCKMCRAEHRRRRYHTDAYARGLQIAHSVENMVRRRFPEARTGIRATEYAGLLLSAQWCDYCGQPNDGTHPFNLDHRVALGAGGRHELANLVPCCEPCNRAKRDMPAETYREWLSGVAARLGGGVRRAG